MSDNGTNIVGANNELKKCLKKLNQKPIKNELLTHNIEWQFIPQVVRGLGELGKA